jgi:hypothetical protein
MARAFNDQGLGLLCMLDDNEYQGLDSFEATQVDTLKEGTRVYSSTVFPGISELSFI